MTQKGIKDWPRLVKSVFLLHLVAELEYAVFGAHGTDLFVLGFSLCADASGYCRVDTSAKLPFPVPLSSEL